MNEFVPLIQMLFADVPMFTEYGSDLVLRSYQVGVAQAIVDSVVHGRGLTFVVIFPRQSGKNELQAQIEAFLLIFFSLTPCEIVKVSPTWKPQSQNAMRRLERTLEMNLLSQGRWSKEQGYIYRIGSARMYFLSAQPSANIVGATASTLLECDEAQEVLIAKWDKEVNPMAASTNATRVFWGTAWTANTLLAREKKAALQAELQDGIQRVFRVDAEAVGQEVSAYRQFVAGEIHKLGRNHPFIKTQYFCEEIDAEGGMFPPRRQELMRGEHPPLSSPDPAGMYAFLIDVAGEDEGAAQFPGQMALWSEGLLNPARDATALTIVEIDLSELDGVLISAPRYLVRGRKLWSGSRHTTIYTQVKALAELWKPRHLVIDATGVGAGLTSFLEMAQGVWLGSGAVIPFLFNASSKSKLGWDFLAVVETGRFKDHTPDPRCPEQAEFWRQIEHTLMEVIPGPQQSMRWGVPDGTRDPNAGDLIHDDLVISAALCTLLDKCQWGRAESAIIPPIDPLAGMGDVF